MNKSLIFIILFCIIILNKDAFADEDEQTENDGINKDAYRKLLDLLKSSNVNLLNFLQNIPGFNGYQHSIPSPPAPPMQTYPNTFQRLYPQNTNNNDRINHMQQQQMQYMQSMPIMPPQVPPIPPSQTFYQSSNKFSKSYKSSEFSDQCGIMRPALGNYVANGKPSRSDSWPWHIHLNIAGNNRTDSETYCGATLISKRFILTAAHCYDDLLASKRARHTLIVMKGIEMVTPKLNGRKSNPFDSGNVIKLRALNVYLHPNYVPAMTESEARAKGVQPGPVNDIAIIEIRHDSNEIYNKLMPICLPEQDYQLNVGTKCKIMGHGFMNAYDEDRFIMPSILQVADVIVSSNQACRDDVESLSIKSKINGDTLCVRGPIHPCVGDSGGPLLCAGKSPSKIDGQITHIDMDLNYDDDDELTSKWYLTGVTSFAVSTDDHDKCGQFKSAVFTKVSVHIAWIRSILNSNNNYNAY
jgi:secreted trypsin-like serine protease